MSPHNLHTMFHFSSKFRLHLYQFCYDNAISAQFKSLYAFLLYTFKKCGLISDASILEIMIMAILMKRIRISQSDVFSEEFLLNIKKSIHDSVPNETNAGFVILINKSFNNMSIFLFSFQLTIKYRESKFISLMYTYRICIHHAVVLFLVLSSSFSSLND